MRRVMGRKKSTLCSILKMAIEYKVSRIRPQVQGREGQTVTLLIELAISRLSIIDRRV